ncbi:MAG: hypothetical protein IT428_30860 [Planctomycetaceae bacterium]|nr:hypothetical protein [Planctomycetaceae bacterium]
MKRTFLTLTMVSLIFLIAAFALGLSIDDPKARDEATQARVGWHINAAMGALVFTAFVHAVVLTYFMGTGRWMEETSQAYQLERTFYEETKAIKYRTIPAMVACLVMLVITAALGSAADPASPISSRGGLLGMAANTVHLVAASLTLGLHLLVTYWEYVALDRNGAIIQSVMNEVRRIREERGLPV